MPQKASSPIPAGFHTITPYLVFNGDCDKAIEFYQKAFGAEIVAPAEKTPDGKVMHVMLKIGDSNVMMSDVFMNPENATGMKTNLWLYVNDSDAYFKRAIQAGCAVAMKMEDAFWGDRIGEVKDPFGHTWNFASKRWNVTPDEMKKRQAEWIESMYAQTKT